MELTSVFAIAILEEYLFFGVAFVVSDGPWFATYLLAVGPLRIQGSVTPVLDLSRCTTRKCDYAPSVGLDLLGGS